MSELKLSVIVSIASETEKIKAALESLFAQTFKDFEMILVGCDPSVKTLERIDPKRIKFFHADQKSARSVGLSEARGEYVYFMDGEGLIFDNGLELLIEAADRNGAEIVHASSFVEREGELVSIKTDLPQLEGMIEPEDRSIFFEGEFNFMSALNLYRRDFLERIKQNAPSDEAFSFAAFTLAERIWFVADYFYVRTLEQTDPISPNIDDDPEAGLVDRLYHDEFRCGFLVTSQRKKLWNVQLHLIAEFDRICRKHNLKWFAYAGTLLGAARHGGFVPWDDDVDLAMMRPDFERLKKVIARELNPNYALDFWFDYSVEGEKNPLRLPTVSKEVFESNAWWPSAACYFKIRDERTSMIEWRDRPHFDQGMCIDIFPLDPSPPFDDQKRADQFKFVMKLLPAVSNPSAIDWNDLTSKQRKFLKALIKKPFRERALEYEKYLAEHWFESEYIAHINSIVAYRRPYDWRREWWDELVELPFERIKIPAPRGYEGVLKAHYGDWREPIITHAHSKLHSADVSYRELFETLAPEVLEHDLR